jgi:hypothetical protein
MMWLTLLFYTLIWILTSLDVVTTLKGMSLGAIETNKLLRDKNKRFVLWKGLVAKAIEMSLYTGLLFLDELKWIAPVIMAAPCCLYVRVVNNNLNVIKKLRKK